MLLQQAAAKARKLTKTEMRQLRQEGDPNFKKGKPAAALHAMEEDGPHPPLDDIEKGSISKRKQEAASQVRCCSWLSWSAQGLGKVFT